MCHDLLASSLVIQSQGGSQLMETQAVVDRLNEQDRLQDSRIEQWSASNKLVNIVCVEASAVDLMSVSVGCLVWLADECAASV